MMSDIDEELTRLAIRHALEQYSYYFETIEVNDGLRAEQLGRVGRAVADQLGVELSMAARPRRDGGIQVCLSVVKAPATPEPV